MFWNKGEPSSTPPGHDAEANAEQTIVLEPSSSGALGDETDFEALETLAAVLRTVGRHTFDLDDVTCEQSSEAFEKWALRLLVGEVPATAADGRQIRQRGIRRDWGGVKRFTEQHRRAEHDYVVTGMANLRQAVRVFIQCTTGNFRAERQSELLVCEELDDLGRALAINDHAQIRAAAEKTAVTMYQQLEARRSREQRQIDLLQDSMEKLRHELNQMRHAAKIDGLTKLFNRAALDEHLVFATDHTYLTATEACIVMIDIDHFKGINDNFGHQAGDEVLRQVAEELVRGFFRREDFVARYGGEEFCIIAEHTTFEATRERAERLRQAVENLAIIAFGKTLHVSVSFGIAALQYGETSSSWIQRADEALYRAKRKGRNCISIAPPTEGEALGGRGAPLGATLNVRSPENPRPAYSGNSVGVGANAETITLKASAAKKTSATKGQVPSPRKESVASAASMASTSALGLGATSQNSANQNSAAYTIGDANQNSEAPPSVRKEGTKRRVGPTRPLGKPVKKEAAPAKSPISALLGPTSRR